MTFAIFGLVGRVFRRKRRVFGFFCRKWPKVRVLGPLFTEIGVSLGLGGLFPIFIVICSVLAPVSGKGAFSFGFPGGQGQKRRDLRCFGAGFGAGPRVLSG